MLKKNIRSKYRLDYPSSHIFDYKDPLSLSKFLSEGAKITPARITKLSHFQQRHLKKAIKKARILGLLPIGTTAYSTFGRPTSISPQPFHWE